MPISEEEWETGTSVSHIEAVLDYYKEIYPKAATISDYRDQTDSDAGEEKDASEHIADAVLRAYFEGICQTLVHTGDLESKYLEDHGGSEAHYRYRKE